MIKATFLTGVGLAVALAIGVPASGSASGATSHHTLTGSVEILDSSSNFLPFGDSAACDGSDAGGYSDLSPGAQVTIKNGSGHIVAIGSLKEGKSNYDGATCTMPLRVSGIPKASFYQVEVSHRGELDYSYARLQSRHWRVALTIGS